jgi:hypothetical protein
MAQIPGGNDGPAERLSASGCCGSGIRHLTAVAPEIAVAQATYCGAPAMMRHERLVGNVRGMPTLGLVLATM